MKIYFLSILDLVSKSSYEGQTSKKRCILAIWSRLCRPKLCCLVASSCSQFIHNGLLHTKPDDPTIVYDRTVTSRTSFHGLFGVFQLSILAIPNTTSPSSQHVTHFTFTDLIIVRWNRFHQIIQTIWIILINLNNSKKLRFMLKVHRCLHRCCTYFVDKVNF